MIELSEEKTITDINNNSIHLYKVLASLLKETKINLVTRNTLKSRFFLLINLINIIQKAVTMKKKVYRGYKKRFARKKFKRYFGL